MTNNRETYRALTITFAGNLLLALIKSYAASASGSSALQADALNSISDVLYSITLVIGLFLALRPPDPTHPQGHRRFEPLVGLVISFSMTWAGIEAVRESVHKIQSGATVISGYLPIVILVVSAAIKWAMYILVKQIAVKISSPTLSTAAEDNLMDTITSGAAAAGILLGRCISPLADPIAGILVSVWIFKAAFNALKENLNFLTGGGTTNEELEEIRNTIMSVPGVLNVHQIFAEYVGTKMLLDIHINIDGETSLFEVHHIESEIEDLLSEIPNVERVYIHAEPPDYK